LENALLAYKYLFNFYKLGLADLEQLFYYYSLYAGRIWITSAEGATAPETLRQKDLHINIKSGEKCLRALAEGITISGKRTEGHH
jgi:hypothetical protein